MIEQLVGQFPISRDPPEGGTSSPPPSYPSVGCSFQFLGIPPKGERRARREEVGRPILWVFPISRDPPEGGTAWRLLRITSIYGRFQFLGIPPKGELDARRTPDRVRNLLFPISRDPPEGGTSNGG